MTVEREIVLQVHVMVDAEDHQPIRDAILAKGKVGDALQGNVRLLKIVPVRVIEEDGTTQEFTPL